MSSWYQGRRPESIPASGPTTPDAATRARRCRGTSGHAFGQGVGAAQITGAAGRCRWLIPPTQRVRRSSPCGGALAGDRHRGSGVVLRPPRRVHADATGSGGRRLHDVQVLRSVDGDANGIVEAGEGAHGCGARACIRRVLDDASRPGRVRGGCRRRSRPNDRARRFGRGGAAGEPARGSSIADGRASVDRWGGGHIEVTGAVDRDRRRVHPAAYAVTTLPSVLATWTRDSVAAAAASRPPMPAPAAARWPATSARMVITAERAFPMAPLHPQRSATRRRSRHGARRFRQLHAR